MTLVVADRPPAGKPARPVKMNYDRRPRGGNMDRYPFRDDGDAAGFLLVQPPGPSFLSLGVPLRQRMAAKVYAECCYGSAGMKIADIPKGLGLLGLEVDSELARGFQGTFSSQGLSLGQWQGCVVACYLSPSAPAPHEMSLTLPPPPPSLASPRSES